MSDNLKRYSFFHIPVLSFFSKSFYVDIGRNWKGLNFFYLLLLLAICWIPIMFVMQQGLNDFVENETPVYIEQVPEITFKDGKVSIKEPEPYYIKDPDSGKAMVIIDTTGEIKSLDDTEAFVLLTEDKVMSIKSEFESNTYDLSTIQESFTVDSDKITSWLDSFRKYIMFILYPFALVGSYVYRIVQVLIYAAIGLVFAKGCKVELSYGTLIRLAVAAVTPCIILGTIFSVIGLSIPGVFFLAAALGYLFFAVYSNSGGGEDEDEQGYVDVQPYETSAQEW